MAADNHTTIVGNLVEDPELRFTNNGIAVATSTTPRRSDQPLFQRPRLSWGRWTLGATPARSNWIDLIHPAARCRRPARREPHEHQLHPEHDLDRARHDQEREWWRDGKMSKRWCAAGMLNAERSFRRLKGYRRMPRFVAALARHVEAVTSACDAARVA